MPTPQLRWTNEEIARLRSAGRSWREISERTGMSVPDAKVAVSAVRAVQRQSLKKRRAAQVLAATACTACGTPHGEHRPDEDGALMCPFRSPGTNFFTTAPRQNGYPQLHGRYRTDAWTHAHVEERLAGVPAERSEVSSRGSYWARTTARASPSRSPPPPLAGAGPGSSAGGWRNRCGGERPSLSETGPDENVVLQPHLSDGFW